MPGLTSILNVANQGVLAEQVNLHITAQNISNVNTPGYSRQSVTLSPNFPTPSSVGPIGNGVSATEITRAYDRFITQTLFGKTSVMSGLQARQSGMQLVEGVFNEVDQSGINGMLSQFWTSWDGLANNAEGIPERTTLLNNASLLTQGINDRYNSLMQLSKNVDLNIDTAVKNINQIADQIADINVRILSMESSNHQANDLRDQRDELVKQLSQLADVHYFETKQGTYTVLIGQGSPLVEGNKSSHLTISDGSVNWEGPTGQIKTLTAQDIKNGTLGGWLDIKSRISPPDTSTLIGSQANTTGGQAIASSTAWSNIDGVTVSGTAPFTIQFSGTRQDGTPITGTYTYDPTAANHSSWTWTNSSGPGAGSSVTGTIGDFVTAVKAAFGNTVDMYPNSDGRLVLKDTNPGNFPISFQIESISGGVTGLNLGKFDGSYPPNYLTQLNNWASELIKAVNSQHSQGVGLIPLTETTASNTVIATTQPISYRASGLPFSSSVQTGSFDIWLYDKNGNVIDLNPATPGVNDPLKIDITKGSTTLSDIQNAINTANVGLTASIAGGRLTISVNGQNGVAGFAFGQDTSGALMALGMNSFFTGHDAGTIGVNQTFINDPRLVAAAQVEGVGAGQAVSGNTVTDPNRPLVTNFASGEIRLWVYDQNGQLVDMDPTTAGIDPVRIPVDPKTTSIDGIVNAINNVSGLSAGINNGKLTISAANSAWKGITLEDTSGVLSYLGLDAADAPPLTATPQMTALQGVTDPTQSLNSSASGLPLYGSVRNGSFIVNHYDVNKNLIGTTAVTVAATDSLNTLVSKLNATGFLSASIDATDPTNQHLVISPTNSGESFALDSDTSGVLNALGLGQISQAANGAYAVSNTASPLNQLLMGVTSGGKFNIYLYDANGNQIGGVNQITVSKYDSLSSVAKKIDSIPGLVASIDNNGLNIRTDGSAAAFALTEDLVTPSGFLGAMDISTPQGGTFSPASNQNALAMGDVSRAGIAGLDGADINSAYQSFVGTVGIDSKGIQSDYAFSQSAVNGLQASRDAVSAVSLDEEMANLIRFQQAYSAAAKLIKVADDLFQSLLAAKQ
ncbi:MAG: flagellar hook-associated protein FlgK [Dissulfurimicrobium sp.]|uniref:flagellar hook-associated protein FlgK n=1 Tax=Dissulfurimicrobium sp. TaxID=2022436 RepID=UPI003D0CCB28